MEWQHLRPARAREKSSGPDVRRGAAPPTPLGRRRSHEYPQLPIRFAFRHRPRHQAVVAPAPPLHRLPAARPCRDRAPSARHGPQRLVEHGGPIGAEGFHGSLVEPSRPLAPTENQHDRAFRREFETAPRHVLGIFHERGEAEVVVNPRGLRKLREDVPA